MHIWIAVYFPSWRSRYYQRRMDEKRIFVFITHYHALWVAGQKRERNNKPKSEWSYFLSFSLGLLNLSREKLERGPHFVFRLYIFFSQLFHLICSCAAAVCHLFSLPSILPFSTAHLVSLLLRAMAIVSFTFLLALSRHAAISPNWIRDWYFFFFPPFSLSLPSDGLIGAQINRYNFFFFLSLLLLRDQLCIPMSAIVDAAQ